MCVYIHIYYTFKEKYILPEGMEEPINKQFEITIKDDCWNEIMFFTCILFTTLLHKQSNFGVNNPFFDNPSVYLRQDDFNNNCSNSFGETRSPSHANTKFSETVALKSSRLK